MEPRSVFFKLGFLSPRILKCFCKQFFSKRLVENATTVATTHISMNIYLVLTNSQVLYAKHFTSFYPFDNFLKQAAIIKT